jgi:ubiquinol-cytochrome c reductase cytochrome c subunit
VKFLSRRRRHPLAGLVVVLLGLVITGALYSAFRPAAADQSTTDRQLVAAGRQLYVVSCATCHGLNGEGVLTKQGTNFGPSLVGVGAAAVDFQVGTGRMPMAAPGVQADARPPQFSAHEVEELAAYIASLGPGPAIPSPAEYDPSGLTEEQIAQGGEFFRTNCTACHNFHGAGGALPGGKYAPTLMGVPPRYIYEAMLTGPQQMPSFSDGVLTPSEKREVIGYLKGLESQPHYGGASLGNMGPVTEGLFGWTLGVGALILVTTWIANNGARATKKKKS